MDARSRRAGAAFTLIELLVVIGIIALLAALLFPAFEAVRDEGKKAGCIANLRQIGVGIGAYAGDNDGQIPYGPKAPPFTSPANLYPATGTPTSLLSLRDGQPVALGLLLDRYLAKTPKVFFCPGSDQTEDADAELAKVGKTQAQSSYYYRHGGNTQLFDNPRSPPDPNLRLANLGNNRKGEPIRALVMDTMFLCPSELDAFNVRPRTYHRRKFANILYTDGHISSRSNQDGRFTVDVRNAAQVRSSFDKILAAFERADGEG